MIEAAHRTIIEREAVRNLSGEIFENSLEILKESGKSESKKLGLMKYKVGRFQIGDSEDSIGRVVIWAGANLDKAREMNVRVAGLDYFIRSQKSGSDKMPAYYATKRHVLGNDFDYLDLETANSCVSILKKIKGEDDINADIQKKLEEDKRVSQYLNRNSEIIRKAYAGKWVALASDVIVAADASQVVADNRAREIGIEIPYLVHFPTDEERDRRFIL